MKHRGRVDANGAVELPEHKQRGSYPPDIARRRRQLGLPVTPEEHAAYARAEYAEPPVTDAQMARTLRDVLPRYRPGPFRTALLDLAARLRAWNRAPGEAG